MRVLTSRKHAQEVGVELGACHGARLHSFRILSEQPVVFYLGSRGRIGGKRRRGGGGTRRSETAQVLLHPSNDAR